MSRSKKSLSAIALILAGVAAVLAARYFLAGDDRLTGTATDDPVVSVESGDPQMKAAVEQARRQWPEFLDAFQNRKPEQPFTIKAPFGSGDRKEFMWVIVESIEGQTVHGILDNEPAYADKVKLGNKVQIPVEQINDWIYFDTEHQPHGGFTVKVLEARRGQAVGW